MPIRDAIYLLVIAAVCLAWYGDRSELSWKLTNVRHALDKAEDNNLKLWAELEQLKGRR